MITLISEKRQSYDKRVNEDLKNFLFILNVIYVLRGDYLLFLHSLDCVLFVWLIFQPSYSHVAESTYNLVLG